MLNSGRSLAATLIIAEALNSKKVKYLVAEHGAVGYRFDTQELIDFSTLSAQLPEVHGDYEAVAVMPDLIDWYRRHGSGLLFEEIGQSPEPASKLANLTLAIPSGMSGETLVQNVQSVIEAYSPMAHHDFVYHISASDGYVDVMSTVDKGTAVRLICLLEKIDTLQTFAIGNGLNDISMFEQVHHSICPRNSEDELKEFCLQRQGVISDHAFIDATFDWLKAL